MCNITEDISKLLTLLDPETLKSLQLVAAFLSPPSALRHFGAWNPVCVWCDVVLGPRRAYLVELNLDTRYLEVYAFSRSNGALLDIVSICHRCTARSSCWSSELSECMSLHMFTCLHATCLTHIPIYPYTHMRITLCRDGTMAPATPTSNWNSIEM